MVAESAARHGLIVAPVGGAFFPFKGKPKLSTKDMDVVIHFEDGDIVGADPSEVESLSKLN